MRIPKKNFGGESEYYYHISSFSFFFFPVVLYLTCVCIFFFMSNRGSPNIEMDEHTFMINRERAVDYLNSLDKVFVNDQFLNWDPENKIRVRIVSARAYHSLFMHNM